MSRLNKSIMSGSNKSIWLVFKLLGEEPNGKYIDKGIFCKYYRYKNIDQIKQYFITTLHYRKYVKPYPGTVLHWCTSYDEAQEKIAELKMWETIL